ncbi:MAG: Resolvase protein, partial [Pelosinus sp.]|nr:Resolvase protein [Pelosinus sp.]
VEDLDEAIWECLATIATSKGRMQDYLYTKNTLIYSKHITHLHKLQLELKKKQNKALGWYHDNLIDSETVQKELQTISAELATIQSTLSELMIAQEKTNQLATSPIDLLQAKTFMEKRNILLKLPYRIVAVRLEGSYEFFLEK